MFRVLRPGRASAVVSAAAVLAFGTAVTGCVSSANDASDSDESSTAPEVIRVGVDPAFGMPYVSKAGNDWSGLQVDIYELVGERLGADVEFVSVKFDSMVPSLQADRIDVAAGGFIDNAERREAMDIITYLAVGVGVIAPEGSDATSLADFCGGSLTTLSASPTYDSIIMGASEQCPSGSSIKIEHLDPLAGPTAVRSGRTPGYLIDNVSAAHIAEQNDGLTWFVPSDSADMLPSGDGTAKDSSGQELADSISSAMQQAKTDGDIQPILDAYGLPADVVSDEITVGRE